MTRTDNIKDLAETLAELARGAGFVVTIEQVPLEPLAMGNHADRVTVRPLREQSGQQAAPRAASALIETAKIDEKTPETRMDTGFAAADRVNAAAITASASGETSVIWRIRHPDGCTTYQDAEPADYLRPYATAYRAQ